MGFWNLPGVYSIPPTLQAAKTDESCRPIASQNADGKDVTTVTRYATEIYSRPGNGIKRGVEGSERAEEEIRSSLHFLSNLRGNLRLLPVKERQHADQIASHQ